jgi:two-component system, chemotaxis family, CheB/CheR fusion protein
MKPIDLSIILEEVIADLYEVIAEKNATIEVNEMCTVRIIRFQFRQLLYNLISNALKFSRAGVSPHIIISCQTVKSGRKAGVKLQPNVRYCHISISDNGIGFSKEFSDKVFEVFQKLHGNDKYAGTGIGLAIVKQIVENHSGFITVKSELDKGTTFNIFIPEM